MADRDQQQIEQGFSEQQNAGASVYTGSLHLLPDSGDLLNDSIPTSQLLLGQHNRPSGLDFALLPETEPESFITGFTTGSASVAQPPDQPAPAAAATDVQGQHTEGRESQPVGTEQQQQQQQQQQQLQHEEQPAQGEATPAASAPLPPAVAPCTAAVAPASGIAPVWDDELDDLIQEQEELQQQLQQQQQQQPQQGPPEQQQQQQRPTAPPAMWDDYEFDDLLQEQEELQQYQRQQQQQQQARPKQQQPWGYPLDDPFDDPDLFEDMPPPQQQQQQKQGTAAAAAAAGGRGWIPAGADDLDAELDELLNESAGGQQARRSAAAATAAGGGSGYPVGDDELDFGEELDALFGAGGC
jgi:hypothetical protein